MLLAARDFRATEDTMTNARGAAGGIDKVPGGLRASEACKNDTESERNPNQSSISGFHFVLKA